ncbi:Asp-tRNA(Asn)/Glu-tRNA(Gln) amidotransferase subunit GatB [Proteinivorax hydrogeniformans]|uniref:Aspartyl/glutamyl-tRNA(Asn/Gln) amidotransferase subunit B n=1 Tax=Proteinivorax hydrogeniformans TaxID=1826727 RepID=A0AAU8HSD2_9FIRM
MMKNKYKKVIGLEIHVELNTASKVFCRCSSAFGAQPNSQVCPTCLGLTGALPVLNEKAVNLALKAALALNCKIDPCSKFDRKSYFYPDLPKGYQITQHYKPIAKDGYIEIETEGEKKKIGIAQLHIEEDAARQIHKDDHTLIDFNRAGVGLIEIVTKPQLETAEEAKAFVLKIKKILQYLNISDCKMEEGSLRCDANISLKAENSHSLGTKTELKNLNSLKSLQKAIDYEAKRQEELLLSKMSVTQQTLKWDESRNKCVVMRTKKSAAGYRYFPEPNIPPLFINEEFIKQVKATISNLPDDEKDRFIKLGLSSKDALVISEIREVSNFFKETIKYCDDIQLVANWIKGELFRHLSDKERISEQLTPKDFASLLNYVKRGDITAQSAKKVLKQMLAQKKSPKVLIEELDLAQLSNHKTLNKLVEEVLNQNHNSVKDYYNGKDKALEYLVGQAMKLSKGKANPKTARLLILEKLQ